MYCVSWREGIVEAEVKTKVEMPLVQILVLVAIIQMRILKAEVRNGFTENELCCELLDPKTRRKRLQFRVSRIVKREWG